MAIKIHLEDSLSIEDIDAVIASMENLKFFKTQKRAVRRLFEQDSVSLRDILKYRVFNKQRSASAIRDRLKRHNVELIGESKNKVVASVQLLNILTDEEIMNLGLPNK